MWFGPNHIYLWSSEISKCIQEILRQTGMEIDWDIVGLIYSIKRGSVSLAVATGGLQRVESIRVMGPCLQCHSMMHWLQDAANINSIMNELEKDRKENLQKLLKCMQNFCHCTFPLFSLVNFLSFLEKIKWLFKGKSPIFYLIEND